MVELMYVIHNSAQFLSKVRSLALDAIFDPFLPTVQFVTSAAPVPSLTITVSPAVGDAGKVIVIDPAVTKTVSPATAV
jgi:hypothetical protein